MPRWLMRMVRWFDRSLDTPDDDACAWSPETRGRRTYRDGRSAVGNMVALMALIDGADGDTSRLDDAERFALAMTHDELVDAVVIVSRLLWATVGFWARAELGELYDEDDTDAVDEQRRNLMRHLGLVVADDGRWDDTKGWVG